MFIQHLQHLVNCDTITQQTLDCFPLFSFSLFFFFFCSSQSTSCSVWASSRQPAASSPGPVETCMVCNSEETLPPPGASSTKSRKSWKWCTSSALRVLLTVELVKTDKPSVNNVLLSLYVITQCIIVNTCRVHKRYMWEVLIGQLNYFCRQHEEVLYGVWLCTETKGKPVLSSRHAGKAVHTRAQV